MKILNSTTRDASDELIKTPISELSETTELPEASLLLAAVPVQDGNGNQAMCVSVKTFTEKLYEAIKNSFTTDYANLHDHEDMLAYLTAKKVDPPAELADTDDFIDHINYDYLLLSKYMMAKDSEFESEIDDIEDEMLGLDCYFDQTMSIKTTYEDSNEEVKECDTSVMHAKNDNSTYCQMEIKDGNKISSEWTVPATGNLVIVGWLDSEDALNNKAIPTSYCVIEGKINGVWEVIGVQPVIPAKTFTYVGFNLLVKKGLVIRARCGFTVGGKSGQYSNEQDGYDTLSNSTPNGFKCQVFFGAE